MSKMQSNKTKRVRQKAKFTFGQMANILGINESDVIEYEDNKKPIPKDLFLKYKRFEKIVDGCDGIIGICMSEDLYEFMTHGWRAWKGRAPMDLLNNDVDLELVLDRIEGIKCSDFV